MPELGKRERLRSGEAVELKEGVWGRLNKENRTLELDSGKILPVSKSDQRDLFPADEAALDTARRAEKLEGQVKKAPFGEFLHQYGSHGIVNAPKDWLDYATQTGDEYLRQKEAEGRVSKRISKESPITSAVATGANIGTDLALTHGMSAVKAAPLLTGISAGSRLAREPEEVAKEVLFAAGTGKILDMGGNALSNMAARRGASRAIPGQQQAVREANIEGQSLVNKANLAQKQQHQTLLSRVENENAARLHQHNLELTARQNKMIKAQNEFEAAKNSANTTKQQNQRLMDEYKLAKTQYDESLKQLPEMQKRAQQEYSAEVLKNASKIEKSFPAESNIPSGSLDTKTFLNQINKSGLAGSKEAGQSSRIINSLFPEGENLSSRELSKRYQSLEESIQRSTPDVQKVLNEFKNHIGEKLPIILQDSIAYNKIAPLIQSTVKEEIPSILNGSLFAKDAPSLKKHLQETASNNLNELFSKDMNPSNFIQKIQNPNFSKELADKVLKVEDFLVGQTPEQLKALQKKGLDKTMRQAVEARRDHFVKELTKKIERQVHTYEIEAIEAGKEAARKIKGNIKGTYGLADPVQAPNAPLQPQISQPPNLMPPQTPAMPQKPILMGNPTPPTPQQFTPQMEPSLPPAQNFTEGAGDFLEKNLMGGRGIVNNPLAKLAGLKYALGPAALPVEAAYLGMKGLTSPTAGGQAARATFKQAGIQAIESWAQKYPSYSNGVLQNPQDRRSLTKEIEDDQEIPLEQKALLQSKVNRGKPLHSTL
jgi:hypothetical protein